jgi:hypothetical protein
LARNSLLKCQAVPDFLPNVQGISRFDREVQWQQIHRLKIIRCSKKINASSFIAWGSWPSKTCSFYGPPLTLEHRISKLNHRNHALFSPQLLQRENIIPIHTSCTFLEEKIQLNSASMTFPSSLFPVDLDDRAELPGTGPAPGAPAWSLKDRPSFMTSWLTAIASLMPSVILLEMASFKLLQFSFHFLLNCCGYFVSQLLQLLFSLANNRVGLVLTVYGITFFLVLLCKFSASLTILSTCNIIFPILNYSVEFFQGSARTF